MEATGLLREVGGGVRYGKGTARRHDPEKLACSEDGEDATHLGQSGKKHPDP